MPQPASPHRLLTPLLAAVLAAATALPAPAQPPVVGAVVAIGGGSEQPALIKEVLELARGVDSRVAIVNTASGDPARSGPAYQKFFQSLGVTQATVVPLLERAQAYDAAVLDALSRADLVYVTGGNQIKLAQTLTDTPAHGALLAAWQRGAVIAGTSAGAMVWGPQYLAAGESRAALTGQAMDLRPGLGLLPRLMVDTHFARENRLGRLLVAAGRQPGVFGVGVDERTAAVLAPSSVRVLGEGRVTVLDYAEATRPVQAPGASYSVRKVRMHVLGTGDALRWTRDEAERKPMLPPRPQTDSLLASLWLQGGPLPLAMGDAATLFGQQPQEVLILAGTQSQSTVQRWQSALQGAGVLRTPVLSSAEIAQGALGPAIERANAVVLVDDEGRSLAKALGGEPTRLLREHASKLMVAGAGTAIAIPGNQTIQVSANEVATSLQLSPGLIPTADWMAEGAFDRLVLDALLSGGALGVGLAPDNGARVAGATLSAHGTSPVLVLQTDHVSLANPNVPSARDLMLHMVAPGESLQL